MGRQKHLSLARACAPKWPSPSPSEPFVAWKWLGAGGIGGGGQKRGNLQGCTPICRCYPSCGLTRLPSAHLPAYYLPPVQRADKGAEQGVFCCLRHRGACNGAGKGAQDAKWGEWQQFFHPPAQRLGHLSHFSPSSGTPHSQWLLLVFILMGGCVLAVSLFGAGNNFNIALLCKLL